MIEREEILGRLRERIVAFAASRYAGDFAEDLAQEVMVVIEEKYAGLDRIEDLLPLAIQITRFKLLSRRRTAHRRAEDSSIRVEDLPLAGSEPDPEILARRAELAERLKAAIGGMGNRCKEIFRMKLEGLSFPAIQAAMGVRSINTIYTWDARCRKQLLERMGGDWEV